MLAHFDRWIIVEGAAGNEGSTRWCKPMPAEYHRDGHSVDDTEHMLHILDVAENTKILRTHGLWASKDAMVNAALAELREDCWLWQVDVDEVWDLKSIQDAEVAMTDMGADCGQFYCDCWLGKGIKAVGAWGEGRWLPYRRLWRWMRGARFATHEPPELQCNNGTVVLLPLKFQHFSYYFEEDVRFKDAWYSNHEGVYENWLLLQKEKIFPQPLSYLFKSPNMAAWCSATQIVIAK
jgi:hypothetical protein